MNMLRFGSVMVLISLFLSGCSLDSADPTSPGGLLIERSFFDEGDEGWTFPN